MMNSTGDNDDRSSGNTTGSTVHSKVTNSCTSRTAPSSLSSNQPQQQQNLVQEQGHTLSYAYQTFFQQNQQQRPIDKKCRTTGSTSDCETGNCDDENDHHHYPDHNPTTPIKTAAEEEQIHYNDVCRAYRQYSMFVTKQFGYHFPHRIANLSAQHQLLLPRQYQYGTTEYNHRIQLWKDATIRNQFVLDCILRHAGQPISQQKVHPEGTNDENAYATEAQLSKVTSVLKSLARDWSIEGSTERDMVYPLLLRSIQQYIPPFRSITNGDEETIVSKGISRKKKICVPGAGVGRLACEIAALGGSRNKFYTVQGNEFSLYMLFASDFILNGPVVSVSSAAAASSSSSSSSMIEQQQQQHPLSISPWLLETRNVHNMADPFRSVQIPDVDPYDMVVSSGNDGTMHSDFTMTAGDFRSVYSVDSEKNVWDGVVTCFFLDASPNIIDYLLVIHHMLQPGGILINFGPLHWHWSGPAMLLNDTSMSEYNDRYDHLDKKYLQSYDYCWEDIQMMLHNVGFDILEQSHDIPTYYTIDLQSMIRTEYRCIHFVAQKRINKSPGTTTS